MLQIRNKEAEFLDLTKVRLYGFEPYQNAWKVASIVRGINAGDDFPAVPVCRIEKDVYELVSDTLPSETMTSDGGHHRAVAHFRSGRPLKVLVVPGFMDLFAHRKVNIKNCGFYRDRERFEKQKLRDPKFR